MAKEYIARDAVLKEIKDTEAVAIFAKSSWPETWKDMQTNIRNIPAADVVEVKRGKWKLNRDGSGTCDQCGFTQKNVWDYDNAQNFCGVCGADMRERRDNNVQTD